MNENLEAYMANVGKSVAAYLLEHNNKVISQLARAGSEEYKKYLERVNGDIKLAYSIMPKRKVSAYDRISYLYDGEYLIYHEKDVPAYIASKNKYFEALEDEANDIDYGGAVQDLYIATAGKISDEAHRQALAWIVKALQFPKIPIMNKVNLLTMLGDSHKAVKEYDQAKEAYNQAFMESMQISQKMTQMSVQMRIKQKLASLGLVKK